MNNTRWVAVLAVVVVILVGGYVTLPALARSGEQTAVRTAVEKFGTSLQNVSLLASSTALAQSFDDAYGAYVDPMLLSRWKVDPTLAIGRYTSSPSPNRIEVAAVTRNDDGSYTVEGTVVETTSAADAPAATYPIHATVKKINGTWLITTLEKGTYSVLPQTETMQGIYGCVPVRAGATPPSPGCVVGIARAQSDGHLLLDLSLLETGIASSLKAGDRIEVTGLVVPINQISSDHWDAYDLDGILQATSLKKL